MEDGTVVTAVVSNDPANSEVQEGESGGVSDVEAEGGGLTDAQTELLERCLHSLKHAKNDSHTLAALLLVRPSLQRGKRLVIFSVSAKTNLILKYICVCSLAYVFTLAEVWIQ